jgi:hypothetical protein
MRRSVAAVLERLNAMPRSAQTRPFTLAVQRPPQWTAKVKAVLEDMY